MNEATFSDNEMRLMEMGGSFIAVHHGMVNMRDFDSLRPGGIVRCRDNPSNCIKVFPVDPGPLGCVAGWISEAEAA